MEITLDKLALQYGTDKSSIHHNYTETYDRILSPLRETTKGLIELGIGNVSDIKLSGASLKMWRDYFKNATIIGIDRDKRADISFGERISVVIGDQTHKSVLDKACSLVPSVDVIIDDASHINKYSIATFEYLWEKLRPGGIYFIEDTLCSSEAPLQNMRYELENFILQLVRGLEINGRIVSHRNCADFYKVNADFVLNKYERWVENLEITRGIYIIRKRPR